MLSQLAQISLSPSAANKSLGSLLAALESDQLKVAKSVLISLHFLFPHELLPALDLLDRRLVTHLVFSESAPAQDLATPDTAGTGAVPGPQWEVFYVRSASAVTTNLPKPKSKYRRVYNPLGMHYEVHLNAWNCACPAFAYDAFGRESNHGLDDLNDHFNLRRTDNEGLDSKDNDSGPRQWIFGGNLTNQPTASNIPVCKHILAVALGKHVPSIFGFGIERREISREEAAGFAGGWGD